MRRAILLILFILALAVAGQPVALAESFKAIGQFSLRALDDGCYQITDGVGREIFLAPRGQPAPPQADPANVVPIPVRRMAMDSGRDASLLITLGVIDTVVAVSGGPKDWTIPQIKKGLADGAIVSLGQNHALDYEQLSKAKPDVFFTWDESLIPMLAELGVPTVITNTELARDLDTQIRFVELLAPLFDRQRQADEYVARVYAALETIKAKTRQTQSKPKIIWGDIYSKRVLVEPGNSWAAQIVEAAGGDYLFMDVAGDTCLEIALERFYASGNQADVMITYRGPALGMATKAQMAKANKSIAGIRPLTAGRVYCPLDHYRQSSHRLDEVLIDLAAIIHPELYPGHKLKFFMEMPEK